MVTSSGLGGTLFGADGYILSWREGRVKSWQCDPHHIGTAAYYTGVDVASVTFNRC